MIFYLFFCSIVQSYSFQSFALLLFVYGIVVVLYCNLVSVSTYRPFVRYVHHTCLDYLSNILIFLIIEKLCKTYTKLFSASLEILEENNALISPAFLMFPIKRSLEVPEIKLQGILFLDHVLLKIFIAR